MTVLREMSVVSGHVVIAMSGISAFSSMFIRGSSENSKIEFCENARKGGRTVRPLIRTRFGSGGGTAHAEPLVSIPPHSRSRRASRSFRF